MAESVFITGADKGLGFSLTQAFMRAGWRVFVGQYDTGTNLETLGDQSPSMLTVVPLDVTDIASVRAAAEAVTAHASSLDVLINNAGIFLSGTDAPLEDLNFENGHFERTMDVNAFGPLRVTQSFLPLLSRGDRKRIINISSEAGSIADCRRRSRFAYCMSKTALNMQCRILQNHLGPQGFTVLAVHPGWMRTDMGGPSADIHPDEAAAGIFRLATGEQAPDDPMYVDYQGNPLPW
jgi:NAD(P)-dependent dehydrogenase (short-subunit alcohol dehydrogenase family)